MEGFYVDLALTPPLPAVVSDVTSLERFRRHQELDHVPIIPRQIVSPFLTAAAFMPPMPTAPIPVFQASAQHVFAFPYAYAPASSFQKEPKRKWEKKKQNSSASVRKKGI